MRDRRVPFFLGSAAVCSLLVLVSEASFRWVAEVTAGTYLVLALLVALDAAGRRRPRHREPGGDPSPAVGGNRKGTW